MIGRVRRYARRHGLRTSLRRGASEVGRYFLRSERVILLVKTLDQITKPRRPADVAVVPLEESHLPGLAELNRRRGHAHADRRFRDYLDRGLGGFVGLRGDEVVGYYWWVDYANADRHPDFAWLGDRLQLVPGDVYGSDFYLLPEARGGAMAGAFLCGVETSLAASGFIRVWGYVDKSNRPARWLYSSRGYQPIGDLTIRHVLSRYRVTGKAQVNSTA
jgi:hypothetical protein